MPSGRSWPAADTAATKISYQPTEAGINGGVARLKVLKPDAILAGGFENQQIIREMARQGLLPQRRSGERLYVSDAGVADWSEDFPRGTLTGVEGTIPGAKASPLLQAKLHHFDPTLANFEYSPESYDAVVLLALAATEAHSALGPDMADQLQDVSAGGVKCHSFRSCKRLIDARHNIDYDGLSGPIEFNEKGDPSLATIGIFQYGPDNTYRALTYPHQRTLRQGSRLAPAAKPRTVGIHRGLADSEPCLRRPHVRCVWLCSTCSACRRPPVTSVCRGPS
jgi:ABC-type branched-subunit amino acid transport system substrate-binding protein